MKTLTVDFRLKTNGTIYDVQYRWQNKKGFCSIWFGSTLLTREASVELNRAFHDYLHRKMDANTLNQIVETFFKRFL